MRGGLSLGEITHLTPELYAAFTHEIENEWTMNTELLASILERLDALLIVTLKANGAKNTPKNALRVPRPGMRARSSQVEPVSFRDYVQHTML